MYATKVDKLVIAIKPANEAQAEVIKVFENVKFVPNLSENLFSITAELSKGACMQSDADMNIFLFEVHGLSAMYIFIILTQPPTKYPVRPSRFGLFSHNISLFLIIFSFKIFLLAITTR